MPKSSNDNAAGFDRLRLDPSFAKLSKPAQRALTQHGIFTPRDLAAWRLKDVVALHGIGPSAIPKLKDALQQQGLDFQP